MLRLRPEAAAFEAFAEHVGGYASDFGRQLDVVGVALDQHLPVIIRRHALRRRDKGRTDIGEVGAELFRNMDQAAVRDRPGENKGPGEEFTNGGDECEGVEPTGVAAGAATQQNQTINAGFRRALGVFERGDVGENQVAAALYRGNNTTRISDAGDHQRRLVFDGQIDVFRQPDVGWMDDQVRCIGSRVRLQLGRDPREPLIQDCRRPRIKGRKRARDAGLGTSDDKVGTRYEKHRPNQNGQFELGTELHSKIGVAQHAFTP